MLFRFCLFIFLFCCTIRIYAAEPSCEELMRDLRTLDCLDKKIYDKLPPIYNFYGQMGYFALPSARAAPFGDITGGYSSVPPYNNYSLTMQVFERIELAGIYRVFKGIPDTSLGSTFGDYSDKGANIKFNFLLPEDSEYALPGFAFGLEDFEGTKQFFGQYFVLTQVIPQFNAEITLGYGLDRMSGLFAGMALSPWRSWSNMILRPITFIAEWDSINYEDISIEHHHKGQVKNSSINWGLQYTFNRWFRVAASRFRGDVYTIHGSLTWNIGCTEGFFCKVKNPCIYVAPANKQPLGVYRSKSTVVQDLAYGLDLQGFTLTDAYLEPGCDKRPSLRLIVVNRQWRTEKVTHVRLASLLAFLAPSNIEEVTVVISAETLLCQEYTFRQHDLKSYSSKQLSEAELLILSSMKEYTDPSCNAEHLYDKEEMVFDWGIRPRVRTFFGSSSGKFKYALDLLATLDGFYQDIYYRVIPGWTAVSTMQGINEFDKLNPSQLLNVNSDLILYYRTRDIRFEEAYIQKNLNPYKAFFGRVSSGFFSVAYAGASTEVLYYPVESRWAIGAEASFLRKRAYSGYGFQAKIRQMVGYKTTWVPYTFLGQYFLDMYYSFQIMPMTLKLSFGQFLARDVGGRAELFRYFPSGLRISIWYTVTNAQDMINGSIYHDKGLSFLMPLDIFFQETSRLKFGTAMSAWLRDVGFRADAGKPLFQTIYDERY